MKIVAFCCPICRADHREHVGDHGLLNRLQPGNEDPVVARHVEVSRSPLVRRRGAQQVSDLHRGRHHVQRKAIPTGDTDPAGVPAAGAVGVGHLDHVARHAVQGIQPDLERDYLRLQVLAVEDMVAYPARNQVWDLRRCRRSQDQPSPCIGTDDGAGMARGRTFRGAWRLVRTDHPGNG